MDRLPADDVAVHPLSGNSGKIKKDETLIPVFKTYRYLFFLYFCRRLQVLR